MDDSYPFRHEVERLPPPLVTDLNGDGRKEVLVATHDAEIQVQTYLLCRRSTLLMPTCTHTYLLYLSIQTCNSMHLFTLIIYINFMCVCVCARACVCVHTHTNMDMYVGVCVSAYLHMYLHLCMCNV